MVNLINIEKLKGQDPNYRVEHLERGVYNIFDGDDDYIIEVIDVDIDSKSMEIRYEHHIYDLTFKDDLDLVLDKMGIKRVSDSSSSDIKAPMPGKVIDVLVKEGDEAKKGDAILILEAMKMENVLKAEGDCNIKKINVAASENVEKNQVLVELG